MDPVYLSTSRSKQTTKTTVVLDMIWVALAKPSQPGASFDKSYGHRFQAKSVDHVSSGIQPADWPQRYPYSYIYLIDAVRLYSIGSGDRHDSTARMATNGHHHVRITIFGKLTPITFLVYADIWSTWLTRHGTFISAYEILKSLHYCTHLWPWRQ